MNTSADKNDDRAAPDAASRQVALATYAELVDRCAALRLNQPISNGSPFHARILIGKLFDIAQKRVQIVSGSLTDQTKDNVDIYGFAPLVEQAKKFLRDPSSILSIVIQSGNLSRDSENRFLKQVIEAQDRNGTVEILVCRPGALNENVPHLMVADSSAYRFEPAPSAQPKNDGITAIGNFGDRDFAHQLDSYFQRVVEYLKGDDRLKSHAVFGPSDKLFQTT